jgi:predicted acetyltransferase
MTIDIRRAEPSEFRALSNTVAAALMFPPRDDDGWATSEPSWHECVSFAAWDGERCVAGVSQFTVDTVVPGGQRLGTGAVSRVGVLTTHRRRGLASALMRCLVDDAAERRLPLMSLRASEAVIYERYGFGMAGEYVEARIDPSRARPVIGAASGTLRLLAPGEVLGTVGPIYGRALGRRIGQVTRPDSWWRRYFADATSGDKSSYVIVHTSEEAIDDGYAHYDVAWRERDEGEGGKGQIHDLIGGSEAVELALWQYLFEVDLVRQWTANERPVDDLVRFAIRDRRAYQVTSVDDEQWVRLVDVDTCLNARAYQPAIGSVVIEVTDPWIEANNGRWRVDAAGATPTDVAPDLSCGIAAMSAAYLGGTHWHFLAAVEKVTVHTPGSVAIADALFASCPLPFSGSFF